MEASGCRVIRYGRRYAKISVYDYADLHLLNKGCVRNHAKRDLVKIIDDPYSFFFQGGDYAEWIRPGDPRFDKRAIDKEIKLAQLDPNIGFAGLFDKTTFASLVSKAIINFFAPSVDKCLGFLMGNHEQSYLLHNEEANMHSEICKRLKVPDMGYSGFTDLYFVYDKSVGDRAVMEITNEPPHSFVARLRCFIHHGMGAANTAGGKINKLKMLVDMVEADLVMMAHVHEQFAKAFLRLEPNYNCSKIGHRAVMGLVTGSYLKTYASGFTGYGEARAYAPTTLGATRAIYEPGDRVLTVENRADEVGLKGDQ